MKHLKKIFFLLSLTLMLCLNVDLSFAKDKSNSVDAGFTIEGVNNPHQIKTKKELGYFYLYEKPAEKDKLKVKLINESKSPKKLKVTITDANTNNNGVTEYSEKMKNSPYLKVPFTSLVDWKEKKFDLSPREVRTIEIPFHMPKDSFKGIIAGGINVFEDNPETVKSEGPIGMSSKYGYTLGVILTNTNKYEIDKNISIEMKKVAAKLDYGRKVVEAEILNPHPYVFNAESAKGQVKSLDTNKVVAKADMGKIKIAPEQIFPMQFDFGRYEMKPGSYLLTADIKTKEKTWHFERRFEIEEKEAEKINEQSPFKVYIPRWLSMSLIILLIVTTVMTIYLWFRKKGSKKNEKEEEVVD